MKYRDLFNKTWKKMGIKYISINTIARPFYLALELKINKLEVSHTEFMLLCEYFEKHLTRKKGKNVIILGIELIVNS